MDPPPHPPPALAPAGAEAPTGAPLVDWILAHPDVGGVVLSHLAPRDVLGLRAACRGARAAVAAHSWDAPLPPLNGLSEYTRNGQHLTGFSVAGRAALVRYRKCIPAARRVDVHGGGVGRNSVMDADVAALTGARSLVLTNCPSLTNAALVGLTQVTALAVVHTPLSGAAWAHLRLTDLASVNAGFVTEAHLPALRGASRVGLWGRSIFVTDDGLAAHLGGAVLTRLELTLPVGGDDAFTGAGLGGCSHLEALSLGTYFGGLPMAHFDVGACLAASAGTLREVNLQDCTGLTPAVLAAIKRLSHLYVFNCEDFTGAGLAGAPALVSLRVEGCVDFSLAAAVRAAGGAVLPFPRLAEVELRGVGDVTDGLLAAALSAVSSLTVTGAPAFAGAALGGLPALTTLELTDCAAFTGTGLPALPALSQLSVIGCSGFTAGALVAATTGHPALLCVAYTQGRNPDWLAYGGVVPHHPDIISAAAAHDALGPNWQVSPGYDRTMTVPAGGSRVGSSRS